MNACSESRDCMCVYMCFCVCVCVFVRSGLKIGYAKKNEAERGRERRCGT